MTANEQQLLNYALQNGIIDTSFITEQIKMQRKVEILKNHPYEIYQGKDGKWYTYVKSDDGRKKIKAVSREKIEDKLFSLYEEKEKEEKKKEEVITVKDVFQNWSNWKMTNKDISEQTFERYEVDFNKYFSKIKDENIKKINEDFVENFINSSISENNMTAKQFSNFRTILYGLFKFAKKKKLVSFSITELITDMEISPKRFEKKKLNPELQVYNSSEKLVMEKYLMSNMDIINLGILLLFKTGLRIGELSALKREDINNYSIYINRTEIRYRDKSKESINQYVVRDYPKSEAGERYVVVPTQYEWIIDKLLSYGGKDYIFEKNGKRIRSYNFRRRLRYICERKINITPKSPHKIRKTYATILLDGNVRESTILNSMGHVDLECTRGHYYYNRASIEDKREELSKLAEL